jgi:hypothetical protein
VALQRGGGNKLTAFPHVHGGVVTGSGRRGGGTMRSRREMLACVLTVYQACNLGFTGDEAVNSSVRVRGKRRRAEEVKS